MTYDFDSLYNEEKLVLEDCCFTLDGVTNHTHPTHNIQTLVAMGFLEISRISSPHHDENVVGLVIHYSVPAEVASEFSAWLEVNDLERWHLDEAY